MEQYMGQFADFLSQKSLMTSKYLQMSPFPINAFRSFDKGLI